MSAKVEWQSQLCLIVCSLAQSFFGRNCATMAQSTVDKLLNLLEDIRHVKNITKFSQEEFREMLPSEDCMKDCTVEELRDIKRNANLRSSSMDKTNDKLKYYNIVKVFLEEEERKRPIDEQFPFVRIDMDDFDEVIEIHEQTAQRNIEFLQPDGACSSETVWCISGFEWLGLLGRPINRRKNIQEKR